MTVLLEQDYRLLVKTPKILTVSSRLHITLFHEEFKKLERIGFIDPRGMGHIPDTVKLCWAIDKYFEGQGIMSQALELYFEENSHYAPFGFEVAIHENNERSLNLAARFDFEAYKKVNGIIFLLKKAIR